MKTIIGLFDYVSDAHAAVDDLVDAGIDRNDISFVMPDPDERYRTTLEGNGDSAAEGAIGGAAVGGVLGGLTGLLLGLGAFAIPGLGVVVAAGPLAAALTGAGVGALAGGLVGALVGWGVPQEEAANYAEGVRRGGTLDAVRAPEERVDRISNIMSRHNPVDIEERSSTWRATGWCGYDTTVEPYSSDQMTEERHQYSSRYDNMDYDDYVSTYRQHYQTHYGTSDYGFDYYDPAYRYGYYLGTNRVYSDYDRWDELEENARRRWDYDYANTYGAWEQFKDAVRHAWEEAKDAVTFDDEEEDMYTTTPSRYPR
jgi:hypothetical protein